MRKKYQFLLLSSTLILGVFATQHQVEATQVVAKKNNIRAIITNDANRPTAEILASNVNDKSTLTLSNLSLKTLQGVKITVFSKEDKSDAYTYNATLDQDGSYKVILDESKHVKDANLTAEVSLVRDSNTTDLMSAYNFTLSSGTSTQPAATTTNATAPAAANTNDGTASINDFLKPEANVSKPEEKKPEVTTPTKPVTPSTSTEQPVASNADGEGTIDDLFKPENGASTDKVETSNQSGNTETATDKNKSEDKATETDKKETADEVSRFGETANATSNELKTVGTLTITNKNEQSGSFDIIISNIETPEGVEEVQVPVWSATGGQDDIQWYIAKKQLDNTYKVSVSISNHNNDLGEYYIHLYYLDRKKRQLGVGSTSTKISKTATEATGKLTINRTNGLTGEFEVVVSDVYAPNGLQEVVVPVWSEAGGQDDIQWYTAAKQADGTYSLKVNPANHKNNLGLFHVHLYYRQNDGSMKGIAATSTKVETSNVSGKLTVINQDDKAGTFDIVVSDVASTTSIKEVVVPVWSEANGQNDIQWYTATKQVDGTFKVSVKTSDHKKETGLYHIHLYYRQQDNSLTGVTTTQTTVKSNETSSTINIVNKNDKKGTFDVVIKDVNPGYEVKEVIIPVWSENSGQDDIQWYTAAKQADGTFKISVSISNHKSNVGDYHVHAYHKTPDGQMKGIGATQLSIQATDRQATGNVSIAKRDDGSFDVAISNVYAPEGVNNILVPVWTDANGQDDINWYTAQLQGDGTYKVTVSPANHGGASGTYHVHTYYALKNGQTVGIAATTVDVVAKAGASGISVAYQGTGDHRVTISGVQGTGTVNVAVWSDADGQNDLVWYNAYQVSPGTYAFNFNAQNHSGTGTYHIHAYLANGNQNTGIAAGTANVTRTNFDAPYFSQSDSRWGHLIYGAYNMSYSGCVPTVVAMAVSGIKGQTVTPTEVANYLYNHTQEFNRVHGAGTTATGVIRGANNWGVNGTAIHGRDALINSLQNGHYVAAAVGNSVFVKSPSTHEILLKGYQNGKTYVMDPYTPNNNGWYDVNYILSIPSNWSGDVYQGTTLIQLND